MNRVLLTTTALALTCGAAIAGEDKRELGAHEHGSGAINMAFDGNSISMELESPGADIVGFEYAATSEEDRAAVDNAIADLARPLDLFVLPAAAGCTVVEASVALIGDDHADHDDHDHDDHDAHAEDEHEDHAHDDHAHEEKEEHAHEAHDHEENEHEEHAEHDHDEHAHDDHEDHAEAEEGTHTEFHAEYMFECANPEKLDRIQFSYFERFPNALELDVQMVSDAGARAFEVERDDPVLDLRGMF